MDINQRIAQWENMTRADPENSMGWFSLGSAYREADRDDEAAEALGKALELDPSLSRAYQLLGQVLVQQGQNERAAQVLTDGYRVAAEQGDVMPQKAMASLLEKIGLKPPVVEQAPAQPAQLGEDQITDRRTGRPGTRLPDPPMRGALGRFIYDNYSLETWREWVGMGTKVINELRLDFSNEGHQRIYEEQMKEWLGISDQDLASMTSDSDQGA